MKSRALRNESLSRHPGRNQGGLCLLAATLAGMMTVSTLLFLLDLSALVLSQSVNEKFATEAALAAARQTDMYEALKVAKEAINSEKTSSLIERVSLEGFDYDGQSVSVKTVVKIRMPAPFPNFVSARLTAVVTEPVLAR